MTAGFRHDATPEGLAVDICAATFKRPGLLREMLASLAAQKLPPEWRARIIVVDNDPRASARETVETFASSAPLEVRYLVEPAPGVAAARNLGLAHASGDFVALIDDDEVAAEDWLATLIRAARRYEADAVAGPTLSDLPENTPRWILRGGFFTRRRRATGTAVDHAAAGNLLLSMALIRAAGRGFDPDFGLTGGEDMEFTTFLHEKGARIVWCDEAVNVERVPPSRLSLRWLLRRHFRTAQIYARVRLPRMSAAGKPGWIAKRLALVVLGGLGAATAWPAGRHRAAASLLLLARNLGQLSALTKRYVHAYGAAHE